MTLHDFVKWCDDNGFDIASTTIDHGTARVELSCSWAGTEDGRLLLDMDYVPCADCSGSWHIGAWRFACDFVDKFGGWARWYGADVVMRLDDGPTIAIRTQISMEGRYEQRNDIRRRYPAPDVDAAWPPDDDEPTPVKRHPRKVDHRPDHFAVAEYHNLDDHDIEAFVDDYLADSNGAA